MNFLSFLRTSALVLLALLHSQRKGPCSRLTRILSSFSLCYLYPSPVGHRKSASLYEMANVMCQFNWVRWCFDSWWNYFWVCLWEWLTFDSEGSEEDSPSQMLVGIIQPPQRWRKGELEVGCPYSAFRKQNSLFLVLGAPRFTLDSLRTWTELYHWLS